MITTTSRPAWGRVFQQPAVEFAPTPLNVLEGSLPAGLRGTLYRNGPGRLQRGGDRVGHWFDGDGAILAIALRGTDATGCYRFVQTEGYRAEAAADRYIFPNYGMTAPGPFWNSWIRPVKNSANTSVLALPDKLLALWEGGNPHALELQTLETFGSDRLDGLVDDEPYSAHPKRDPQTGEIYNFGLTFGPKVTINLYRSAPDGKILQRGSYRLDCFPMLHDFAIAGGYLIFCIPPVRINLLRVFSGLDSFGGAARWQPQHGTEILVFDRETLSLVSRSRTDPWFQWHLANGCETPDGEIALQLARFPDFRTNQHLKEVTTGRATTLARATLWQLHINPKTGEVVVSEELCDRGCEFPVVRGSDPGQPWPATYLTVHRDGGDRRPDLFNAIARYDTRSQTLTVADAGASCYPSEPIHAADADVPERGWLLTVVYDGARNTSEAWIYPDDLSSKEPICRLALPQAIPHGFHGTWHPAR
ncbi:lignostilbene-alpha,beta-dioxygenase [Rubidibacter lacunae KORDI 51-2]|uniref:Lignostilbene-alpha,beta-dioxygenase n=1 Tax=Rubidibacter lacunae KORDI 51-2 TaxID=582515 RepID=U5DLR5_9CHRO|nr:carotenoid oxygenase family protein [Rubidibacter lacunae]ERN40645.1 lignostilbene-alpha,beta-dioxygenase [Rubidibacter lacunae KORDI 51-2]